MSLRLLLGSILVKATIHEVILIASSFDVLVRLYCLLHRLVQSLLLFLQEVVLDRLVIILFFCAIVIVCVELVFIILLTRPLSVPIFVEVARDALCVLAL